MKTRGRFSSKRKPFMPRVRASIGCPSAWPQGSGPDRRLGRWSALTLERTLSDLVNEAYGLTPAEIALMWQTAPATPPA